MNSSKIVCPKPQRSQKNFLYLRKERQSDSQLKVSSKDSNSLSKFNVNNFNEEIETFENPFSRIISNDEISDDFENLQTKTEIFKILSNEFSLDLEDEDTIDSFKHDPLRISMSNNNGLEHLINSRDRNSDYSSPERVGNPFYKNFGNFEQQNIANLKKTKDSEKCKDIGF